MAKIKLTKGELKQQRDALKQFQRYLPTLQLKKQQLQLEILHQENLLEQKIKQEELKRHAVLSWAGLLAEAPEELKSWIKIKEVFTESRNIAGVDIRVFLRAEFDPVEYDLFLTPLWVDVGVEALCALLSLAAEISVIEEGAKRLRAELRLTSQRVNLFEKVKIPEAEEAIRLIKIYIGDQMANAVGRCKIAKRKIEESLYVEALA